MLSTRRQQQGESLDSFLQALKDLSRDCSFGAVTADQHRDEYIRDSFITGIASNTIRQRLLENSELDLQTMFAQARSLDIAQKSSESYQSQLFKVNAAQKADDVHQSNKSDTYESRDVSNQRRDSQLAAASNKCPYCGYNMHPRQKCPARNESCRNCGVRGHFTKVCFRNKGKRVAAMTDQPNLRDDGNEASGEFLPWLSSIVAVTKSTPDRSITKAYLGNSKIPLKALADSGSDLTFIHPDIVSSRALTVFPANKQIAMANTSLCTNVTGRCKADITVGEIFHANVELLVLPGLCANLILGRDFLSRHESVTMKFGGKQPPLVLGALGTLNIEPPPLFPHLHPSIKPIADKSRKYSIDDQKFIDQEVKRLLSEGIIEKSKSPWRAQCVVTKDDNHKKRLAIDYSATVNKYTHLDAYPVPCMSDIVNKIAQYKVFSTIDLRSAYHQIKIQDSDMPYTAFEAGGGLYQFRRLPFGVTNGVAIFQREMDKLINENNLDATFAYLDNITVCGRDQAHHDVNLQKFITVAKEYNLTYNQSKCEFSTKRLRILGSLVEDGTIKPDPDRLKPLLDLKPPQNPKELRRVMGFFAHYSKYIKSFSAKLRPLSQSNFPLSSEAITAFNTLKSDIQNSVMGAVDVSVPFTLETDASDYAIGAVLNQSGRPVAFFSRTLQPSEVKHSAVEKEAQAIIESVRYWRHFLTCSHFTLRTDQKSVSFMFDKKHQGKIKNDKIHRWRMELSCYSFDVEHTPGIQNIPADTFSRSTCSGMLNNELYDIHNSLCHPGVIRMYHFCKTKNLPYTLEEVRSVLRSCQVCAQNKPRFIKTTNIPLIKATQPFERLSVDFKGPLPSTNKNIYMLNIVDEFSRYPFSYACPDMSSATVIKCFKNLFSMFGSPSYIHTDQGSSFMSRELKQFLLSRNVSTSRSTPYHPEGNGQVEKTNSTIWKTITLALKSRDLPSNCWQEILPDALDSIRSLLCTATNRTPHERLFLFQRHSTQGSTVPTWLTDSETALLRRHVRNKNDPLVDEVEVLHVNPKIVHVRTPSGEEKTVNIRDLAPSGKVLPCQDSCESSETVTESLLRNSTVDVNSSESNVETNTSSEICQKDPTPTIAPPEHLPRRSLRENKGKAPERLTY